VIRAPGHWWRRPRSRRASAAEPNCVCCGCIEAGSSPTGTGSAYFNERRRTVLVFREVGKSSADLPLRTGRTVRIVVVTHCAAACKDRTVQALSLNFSRKAELSVRGGAGRCGSRREHGPGHCASTRPAPAEPGPRTEQAPPDECLGGPPEAPTLLHFSVRSPGGVACSR
jgi:hypothetical protein